MMSSNTKKIIDRNTIEEFLVALLFVIPYAETGKLSFAFSDSAKTFYWRSILVFEMGLCVVLMIQHMRPQIRGKTNKSVFLYAVYLMINGVLSIMLGASGGAMLVTMLSTIVPLVNATFIISHIERRSLDINKIVKWAVNLYTLFVVYCVALNIVRYGLTLSYINNKFRLSASAGGPVILGYTISLVAVFMFANKDIFSTKNLVINSVIFTLAITYTMDRGAYVILLLGVLYLALTEKNKVITGLFVLGFIFGVIYLSDEILGKVLELLFGNRVMSTDLTESMRYKTAITCLSEFIKEPIFYLTGHGTGNFFPFQQWTASNAGVSASAYARFDVNLFSYNGSSLLVQPHNTFIYFLMETGFIGIVLFLRTVLIGLRDQEKKISPNVLIVVLSFLLLGMLESTIIVQPGIACMWWLMIFFTKIRSNSFT